MRRNRKSVSRRRIPACANNLRAVQLDATYRYVSRVENLSVEVPGSSELDLRLAWQPTTRWEIAVVGQNLLHRRHAELGLFPSARKSRAASKAGLPGVTNRFGANCAEGEFRSLAKRGCRRLRKGTTHGRAASPFAAAPPRYNRGTGHLSRENPATGSSLDRLGAVSLAKRLPLHGQQTSTLSWDVGNDHAQCKDLHLRSGSVPVETKRFFSQINVDESVSYFKLS